MQNMDFTAIFTLLAALISALVAFFVSKWEVSKMKRSSETARLNEQLFNILKIQIKYPFLEHAQFVNAWSSEKAKNELNYQRYDSYCCMLFNFMWQIYELYNGDKNRIENFFAVAEEIRIHKIWWNDPLNPRDNIEGYNGDYRKYITSIIEKESK
jgi:hypothetical protein